MTTNEENVSTASSTDDQNPKIEDSSNITEAANTEKDTVEVSKMLMTMKIWGKINNYFQSIANEMTEMKEDSKQRGTGTANVHPSTVVESQEKSNCQSIENTNKKQFDPIDALKSEKTQGVLGGSESSENIGSKDKDFQKQIKYLDDRFKEHESLCTNQLQRMTYALTNKSLIQSCKPDMKILDSTKVLVGASSRGKKLKEVKHQLEEERTINRHVLGLNSQLRAQLKMIRSQLSKADSKHGEIVEKKVRKLKIKCDQLSEENTSLTKLAEMERETAFKCMLDLDSVREENIVLKHDLRKFERQFNEIEEQIAFTKSEYEDEKNKKTQQTEAIQHLESKVENLTATKKEYKMRVRDLLDEIEILKEHAINEEMLQAKLSKNHEICRELQKALDVSQIDHRDKDEKILSLGERLTQLSKDTETLNDKLQVANKENEMKGNECSNLLKELHKYKMIEKEIKCAEKFANECKFELQKENLDLNEKISFLEKENTGLQESLAAGEELRMALESENSCLKTTIGNKAKECDYANSKLMETEQQRSELEEQLALVKDEVEEMESDLRDKTYVLSNLDATRGDLDTENERLEVLNADLSEKILGYRNVLTDYSNLKRKYGQRLAELSKYKAETEELRTREEEDFEHLTAVIKKNECIEEQILRIKEEKLKLEQEFKTYRTERARESMKVGDKSNDNSSFECQLKRVLHELQLPSQQKRCKVCEIDCDQLLNEIRKKIQENLSHVKNSDHVNNITDDYYTDLTNAIELVKEHEGEKRDIKNATVESENNVKVSEQQFDPNDMQALGFGRTGQKEERSDESYHQSLEDVKLMAVSEDTQSNFTSLQACKNSCHERDAQDSVTLQDRTKSTLDQLEETKTNNYKVTGPSSGNVAGHDNPDEGRLTNTWSKEHGMEISGSGEEIANKQLDTEKSKMCEITKEHPRPTSLSPIINSLPSIEKKSLLATLPSVSKADKKLKSINGRNGLKKSKRGAENATKGKPSKKASEIITEQDDMVSEDKELDNDDVTKLLDDLLEVKLESET